MTDPLRTLCDWIDVPSITGDERAYADVAARALSAIGLDVELQEVEPGRPNVLARAGRPPEVVFCTHLDTVPPFLPPRLERDVVHGRGACDAKGQALAMCLAAKKLLADGEDRIGFLLTVGEETDSAGAKLANARLAEPWAPRHVIVGEPTDNTFVRGHKGLFKCTLRAHGVAGHSSQDVGPSAIHELVLALQRVLAADWGFDPRFGRGTVNVGVIRGGLASNVVAPEAEAEVLFRLVEDADVVRARLEDLLGRHVELAAGKGYGPIAFQVPEGEASVAVAFGTDAPYLPRWGEPLLYGAGSILVAHTDHEHVTRASLERAVAEHERTVRRLLPAAF